MKNSTTYPVSSDTKNRKILDTMIKQINAIFTNNQIYSNTDFQKLLDKIIGGKEQTIQSDRQSQYRCFDTLCYIINNFCNNTKIKKLYNGAPHISLSNYTGKTLDQQLLHNIYHDNRQEFYNQNIGGGNCHYRTIIFKKIFDIFEQKGLQTTNKIIVYKNTNGHSYLLIHFQGKDYIADVGGFDTTSGCNITGVETLDQKIQSILYDNIKTHNQKNCPILVYEDTEKFAKYIDNKPIENIVIQFKPKMYNDTISDDIDIVISKTSIIITINQKKYKIHIPPKYSPQKHITTSKQFFNDVIDTIATDPTTKKIYNKYIYMIADKIDYNKIKLLYQ